MSSASLTADEIRALLIALASNMLDRHRTEPESRPRARGQEPLNVADSRAHTAALHQYFESVTAADLRLSEMASLQLSVVDFIDLIPEDRLISAMGDSILDDLLERARTIRG